MTLTAEATTSPTLRTSFPKSTDVLGLVRQQASKLVPPVEAMKAIRLADDPASTASQIATAISSDIRLTTQLLSLVNSAAFAGVQQTSDIRAAVSRLGVRRVRNLVLATSLASVMKQMPIDVEWANEAINRHGRLTALVSTKVAGALPVALMGEEFAAGLIHDIGRLSLFSILGSSALEVDPLTFDESFDPRDSERAVLGTDHCEVGALLLRTLGFPDSLLEVVHFHHDPENARSSATLTLVVAIADEIANNLQRERGALDGGNRADDLVAQLAMSNNWTVEEAREWIAEVDFSTAIDECECVFV